MKPTLQCVLLAILLARLTGVAQTNSSSGVTPTPAPSTTKAKPAPAATQPAREASSGMATGRQTQATPPPAGRVDQWPKASGALNAKSSGHATEKLDVVEYKDGEDGTMHTRPSNKTSQTPASTLPPTAPTAQPATDADAKKHVANVKYEDRQAAPAALDAASKDAAKSVVSPRDPHSGQASGK